MVAVASSSHAIAGALGTMSERLQKVLDETETPDLADILDQDFETLDEAQDEWDEENGLDVVVSSEIRAAIRLEMEELRHFKRLATGIRENSKGKALLTALDKAFVELERLKAAKKAIIFTESKRTQAYLLGLLENTPYGHDIVLFNGTNSDERAQKIYRA